MRASIQETKTTITTRKNIRSWCRSTIFSIISVAGVWKFICQGAAESRIRATKLLFAATPPKEVPFATREA
jgi:hypothetical protein